MYQGLRIYSRHRSLNPSHWDLGDLYLVRLVIGWWAQQLLKKTHDYSASVLGSWLRAVLEDAHHITRHHPHVLSDDNPLREGDCKYMDGVAQQYRQNKSIDSLCGARGMMVDQSEKKRIAP